MADAVVGVTQGAVPDRLIDNDSLTVGSNTVYRQRIRLAGGAAGELVRVTNGDPVAADYGFVSRDITLARRYSNMSGTTQTVTASGDTTVYTPGSGKAIRLKWLGMSSPDSNANSTVATVKLGGTSIYAWDFSKNGGAFAHGCVREGSVNGTLVINLSVAATLHVSMDLEEI
jgi:endonuclease YncB( thermonuclease family)